MKIVLTGGPCAGKTAVLELIKRSNIKNIVLVPEAAGVLFGGGFWRHNTIHSKLASQRAIYYIQRELEYVAEKENSEGTIICDRGTLDGLAYWPTEESEFWKELGTSKELELKKYDLILHLRTPNNVFGYNHQNPLRIESVTEALEIDERIIKAWEGHPNRIFIESRESFIEKASEAISIIKKHMK